MNKEKEELLAKVDESKKVMFSKVYEKYKKERHDAELSFFKIKLMTTSLDDLYYDDLPVSEKVMRYLVTCTSCKNLLEFWTAGVSGIQIMLSENGVNEELPIVMKSVNRMMELIYQFNIN